MQHFSSFPEGTQHQIRGAEADLECRPNGRRDQASNTHQLRSFARSNGSDALDSVGWSRSTVLPEAATRYASYMSKVLGNLVLVHHVYIFTIQSLTSRPST